MELLRVAELLDDLILNMAWGPVDALLNELGAKLILRQIDEVTFDVLENLFADLVVELFQNFWHYKIAILTFRIIERVF